MGWLHAAPSGERRVLVRKTTPQPGGDGLVGAISLTPDPNDTQSAFRRHVHRDKRCSPSWDFLGVATFRLLDFLREWRTFSTLALGTLILSKASISPTKAPCFPVGDFFLVTALRAMAF